MKTCKIKGCTFHPLAFSYVTPITPSKSFEVSGLLKNGKCKSVWELMLGAGLSHGRKENVIKEFPLDEASNLRELLDSNEDWMFSFKEAVCKTCHNCIALPVIQGAISKEILAYGICPVCCSKEVKPALAGDMGCPQCGSGRITLCETGDWD